MRRTQSRCFTWMVASLIAMLAIVTTHSSALAQAQRQGLLLNLGMGVGAFRYSSDLGSYGTTGISTDFKLGYAPSNHLLIYYASDVVFWDDDPDAVFRAAGMSGIGATYFLDSAAPSVFFGGGVGRSALVALYDDGEVSQEAGIGVSAHAGYEITPKLLLDGKVVLGRLNDEFSGTYTMRTIRIGLNCLFY